MYEYRATVVKVVDGDTLIVLTDLGFSIFSQQTLRLYGINAPEMVGPSKTSGQASKAYLESLLPVGVSVVINTYIDKKEKWGRYLASIPCGDSSISEKMIEAGHAVKYDGKGPRP
jgi:micrococcal nuclease